MTENSQEINVSDPPLHPSGSYVRDSVIVPVDLTWEVLTGRKSNEPEKKEWPELVGLAAEEAERKIKEEMEGAITPVVPENSFVTMDYRTNRVRLFVDGAGKVVQAPRIG